MTSGASWSAGLSAAARSVWAKNPDQQGDAVLSLAQHLQDSADVASHVWAWLPGHVRELVDAALPQPGGGRTLLRFLAGVHDIGKCSPPFAVKVPALADVMATHGLVATRLSDAGKAPHGLVGQLALQQWLAERLGFRAPAARTLGVVVGGHHGRPPSQVDLEWVEDRPDLVGRGRWHEVRHELLDLMTARSGADELLRSMARTRLPATVQAVLSGAVIVSDWLASNEELFPLRDAARAERAQDAWTRLALPPPWQPEDPVSDVAELMSRRFPGLGSVEPRPVQTLAVEAARACSTPSLVIVEAAMGSGKTEAALLAAEVLASRLGLGGVYVALPTMATSDAMFGRVLRWIEHLEAGGPTSTHLAHGKAQLNEDYRGLVAQGRARGVHDDDTGLRQSEAQVLSWLRGRKTGALATMVVGTIDQLLFTALQAKHLSLRHLAFAGKVVVVDEVHAADDYMRSYLARTLEWLAGYGVPVVLMSATLPRAQRQELADAYGRGLGATSTQLPDDAPYPLVTRISADEVAVGEAVEPARGASELTITCCADDDDAIAELLEEELADGGCAAVIRNTVGRAQATAGLLRDRLSGVEVVLAHSRFVATHRAAREARLRTTLGPDGGHRPDRLVVVGTQVLEQSLDVDFDLMVSDLAPVDLLLQRSGRLHRHRRGDARPPRLRRPRLLVAGVERWSDSGVPEPVAGSRAVYAPSRLLRCAAVLGLAAGTTVRIGVPDDIRPLVEAAYAEDPPGPPAWREMIAAADDDLARRVSDQRDRARAYQLRPLAETKDLRGWLGFGGRTEADDPRNPGASRVRDSEDGLEVIVVQREATGQVVCLRDGGEHAGALAVPDLGPPEESVARALAASTLRLPFAMTNPGTFDATLDALERDAHEGWQQSPWLRGQLALHLDDDWRTTVGAWELSYDLETGLQARRAEA